MAINGGNPDPVNNGGRNAETRDTCPFCESAVWSLPRHLRENACEAQP